MASDGNNNPNENLFPLESAENGIAQAVRSLTMIETRNDEQAQLKEICLADLKELQQTSLFVLRRAIE